MPAHYLLGPRDRVSISNSGVYRRRGPQACNSWIFTLPHSIFGSRKLIATQDEGKIGFLATYSTVGDALDRRAAAAPATAGWTQLVATLCARVAAVGQTSAIRTSIVFVRCWIGGCPTTDSTGILHMEPSQPVESDSKSLDLQFAFE